MDDCVVFTARARSAWLIPRASRSRRRRLASLTLSSARANAGSFFRISATCSRTALPTWGLRLLTEDLLHPLAGHVELSRRRLLSLLLVCVQQHHHRTHDDHVEDAVPGDLQLPQLPVDVPRHGGTFEVVLLDVEEGRRRRQLVPPGVAH